VSEVYRRPLEQSIEAPIRVGQDRRRQGNAFAPQSGSGQRNQKTFNRLFTGNEIIQARVDHLTTRESQGCEASVSKTSYRPPAKCGPSGDGFPCGRRQAFGAYSATLLSVALESSSNVFGEFHSFILCLGGKYFNQSE